mgnify:CR=1 FL=1
MLGTEAFNDWGWRIPFLLSLLMVAIAIYIRLRLQETPIFQALKAKEATAVNPWREAFMSRNLRYVLIASVIVIWRGLRLVQQPVLGALLPADGEEDGRAGLEPDRGRRVS